MKYCSKCETIKDASAFSTDRATCKDCLNAEGRRRRRDLPEEEKQLRQAANLEAGRVAREAGITKVCCFCHQAKPFVEFGWNRSSKDGSSNACRLCATAYTTNRRNNHPGERDRLAKLARRRQLKMRYGLTEDEAAAMVKQQSNACAICKDQFGVGRDFMYRIDHDHATGQIRGLLCSGCNLGLGNFKDSPEQLRHAADYLEKYQKQNTEKS